jgi:hypothetical protein
MQDIVLVEEHINLTDIANSRSGYQTALCKQKIEIVSLVDDELHVLGDKIHIRIFNNVFKNAVEVWLKTEVKGLFNKKQKIRYNSCKR